MIETFFLYLGLICLTVLFVNATPIMMLRDKLGLLEMDEEYPLWRNRLIELISCPMCSGFWIGFISLWDQFGFFESILGGCIVGVFSEILNKNIRKD